eukprot:1145604-Pelagomonas_calceolata.AAC.2
MHVALWSVIFTSSLEVVAVHFTSGCEFFANNGQRRIKKLYSVFLQLLQTQRSVEHGARKAWHSGKKQVVAGKADGSGLSK